MELFPPLPCIIMNRIYALFITLTLIICISSPVFADDLIESEDSTESSYSGYCPVCFSLFQSYDDIISHLKSEHGMSWHGFINNLMCTVGVYPSSINRQLLYDKTVEYFTGTERPVRFLQDGNIEVDSSVYSDLNNIYHSCLSSPWSYYVGVGHGDKRFFNKSDVLSYSLFSSGNNPQLSLKIGNICNLDYISLVSSRCSYNGTYYFCFVDSRLYSFAYRDSYGQVIFVDAELNPVNPVVVLTQDEILSCSISDIFNSGINHFSDLPDNYIKYNTNASNGNLFFYFKSQQYCYGNIKIYLNLSELVDDILNPSGYYNSNYVNGSYNTTTTNITTINNYSDDNLDKLYIDIKNSGGLSAAELQKIVDSAIEKLIKGFGGSSPSVPPDTPDSFLSGLLKLLGLGADIISFIVGGLITIIELVLSLFGKLIDVCGEFPKLFSFIFGSFPPEFLTIFTLGCAVTLLKSVFGK